MSSAQRFTWYGASALLGTIITAFTTGCELPPGGQKKSDDGLSPVLVRMRDAYTDLRHGPFVSLAHFESPEQAKLFRVAGSDDNEGDRAQPSISVLRNRNETGAGGLKAKLSDPDDRLIFDGKRSQELALIRDWRDYALLLVSIYGPRGGLALEFTVRSGTDVPLHWTRRIHVPPGWKLLRFDLAEIGEWVDLADIRALSWQAPQIESPVEIYLDDLILTDNRRHLFGEHAADGELYVFERGRSIHVGARGRYELAFRDGVITAWTAADRGNLTVASGLGPFPLPLAEGWSAPQAPPIAYDDPQLFAHWGKAVNAAQQIVEMSSSRVVVRGEWRFVNEPGGAGHDEGKRPAHVWQYTVYPSGQVYVRLTSSAGNAGWATPRVGFAVALDGRRDFARIAPEAGYEDHDPIRFVLMSQPGASRPDLLWCPHAPEGCARQLELASADDRRLAVIAGDVEADATVTTAHLLRFWPHDIDGVPEAETFAGDYQHPAGLTISTGRAVTDATGDLDHDGYNESEGCYELAADAGVLRFTFDPHGRLRHAPVFRVHETAGRQCWVYADGRIIETASRDRDGALLFGLPQVISSPRNIEVISRPPDSAE